MGKVWSNCRPTPEERVIQKHHNDLQETIINPLSVASKLFQEGVVGRTLVSQVSTQGRSQLQNSTAIITAVTASIHSKLDHFQVFMSVLEDNPESANLARRMRNELRKLKPAPGSTERLKKRKGWRYTVSAEYKEDFIDLQNGFGNMSDCSCKALRSHVSVTNLKTFLCRRFSELVVPLQDAFTIDDVLKTLRDKSSLTDFAYFKMIAKNFNLEKMKQYVEEYRSKLNSFCQHTLNNHSYVKSFREDYPRHILSSDKIVFKLQWNANERTLKDIRDVLQMCFGQLADRVQIVVIEDGSVVVVCCAPQYLMKELVRRSSRNVHKLAEIGVVKLTVGDTEVIIKKVSGLQNVNPMLPSRRVALQGTHQRPILAEYNELSSDDDSQMERDIVHLSELKSQVSQLTPLSIPIADMSSDVHHSDNIWFWIANYCFLVSFILEITLVFKYFVHYSHLIFVVCVSLWLSCLWLSSLPVTYINIIVLIDFLGAYELIIIGPLFSRYMATIWFVKSFCKVTLCAELILAHFRKHDHQLQQYLLYFSTGVPYYFGFFGLVSLVIHVFVYEPLGYILIIILLYGVHIVYIVVSLLNIYLQCYHGKKLSFSKYFVSGSFLYTLCEAVEECFIIKWDATVFSDLIKKLIILLFHVLLGVLLINQKIIYMRLVWKVVSMISVLMYYLYHCNEFSILLLIITSLFLISYDYDYNSVLSITVLFLTYCIFDLYQSWASDFIFFFVTHLCQLSVVGALLYSIGYSYPGAATHKTT